MASIFGRRSYRSASVNSGGAAYSNKQPENDHDPTISGTSWNDVDPEAASVGNLISYAFKGFLNVFGLGVFADLFSKTPAEIWTDVTNTFIKAVGVFAELIGGFISGAIIPFLDATKVLGLPALFTNVASGFANIFNAWFGGSSAAGTPEEVQQTVESIRIVTKDGYTLQTFVSSNPAWPVPPELADAEVAWAGAIGGGGKGMPGAHVVSSVLAVAYGGEGGVDGGYQLSKFIPSALGATLAITIGAAGTTNGANGGATSIGSLVSSTPGVSGIQTPEGYQASSSKPGRGGRGGDSWNIQGSVAQYPGESGEPSAVGAGGAGGTTSDGTAGGSGGTSDLPIAGGGGGGGGSGRDGFGQFAWIGGNGGYPGGASGGGGGHTASGGGGGGGVPGNAANGFAFLIWK